MILSSAAQMLNAGGGSGDTTLATVDFVNGVYTVAGAPVLLADIIDQPELVAGGELVIPEAGDVVAMIGGLLTVMLTTNWTIVMEWLVDSSVYPLVVSGAGADHVVRFKRITSSHYLFAEDFGGAGYRGVADSFAFDDGVHKIALTRTDAKLVFSMDGRAVATGDIDNFSLSPTDSCFGGYPGDSATELHVKSLRVYAPVADGLLPALST